jgi:hypothetical protein
MSREPLQTGSTIDGFKIGEKIHTGGMATLWRVTRPDIEAPIVMKVPTILDGEDATVIVGFEMEMMILPRLSGVHVPKFYAVGDFARQPDGEALNGPFAGGMVHILACPAQAGGHAAEVYDGAALPTALGVIDSHRPTLLGGQPGRGRTDAPAAAGDQYNGFQKLSPARNARWGYKRGPSRPGADPPSAGPKT